jgi:ABC-type sugar transport system permease subunit
MHIKRDRIFAVLVLLPSLILIGAFVYGFIVRTDWPLTAVSAVLLAWIVLGRPLGPVPLAFGYQEMHGFNLAVVGAIVAAVWQYSGYTMAPYYAGLRGLAVEVHG